VTTECRTNAAEQDKVVAGNARHEASLAEARFNHLLSEEAERLAHTGSSALDQNDMKALKR